jgi:hypothetical protein
MNLEEAMTNLSPVLQGIPESYELGVPSALLIADRVERRGDPAEALALAGFRLRRRLSFAEAAHDLSAYDGIDLIVIEGALAPDELFDIVLARADTVARERALSVVATVLPEQIDVAAQLLGGHLGGHVGGQVQLLCHPDPAERTAALALARWRAPGQLNDASRDAERVRLQRLNEEVARIADTLARLTRGEDGERRGSVRDPGSGYRGQGDGAPADISAQEVRGAIRSRRMRAQFFEGELFADPAWDMLLDLFASALERRRVSVSSLCIAAAVPPTTALRWIGTLHEYGLFERQADPSDRRRAYIALSSKGLEAMRSYAGAVKRAGLPLI